MAAGAHRAVLEYHAQTPPRTPVRLAAAVSAAHGELTCTFILQAQLAQLVLPAAAGGGRRDELWRHTCFELFVSTPGATPYYEFNFAPSLEWAAYRFHDYRRGMEPAALAPPQQLRRGEQPGELTLAASVATGALAGLAGAARLEVGLAAVLEELDGTLSYWALRHPPGRPDFHRREGFALELSCA
jgi:hypothetical protein